MDRQDALKVMWTTFWDRVQKEIPEDDFTWAMRYDVREENPPYGANDPLAWRDQAYAFGVVELPGSDEFVRGLHATFESGDDGGPMTLTAWFTYGTTSKMITEDGSGYGFVVGHEEPAHWGDGQWGDVQVLVQTFDTGARAWVSHASDLKEMNAT